MRAVFESWFICFMDRKNVVNKSFTNFNKLFELFHDDFEFFGRNYDELFTC